MGNQTQSTVCGRPGRANAQAVNPSASKANPLPSARARPEALWAADSPAARTSRELCNTSDHVKRTPMAVVMARVAVMDSPV